MTRRKRAGGNRPTEWDFPPDVFWIAPDGTAMEVVGHLTAMREDPAAFGLDEVPRTRAEADAAFLRLLEEGWVRGRFSDGTFSFQLDRPRTDALENALALVLRYARHARSVDVDFWSRRHAPASMGASEFIEAKFPVRWSVNPKRPGGG